jgi:hypothetical protein
MEQTRNVKKAVRRMAKLWWRTVETWSRGTAVAIATAVTTASSTGLSHSARSYRPILRSHSSNLIADFRKNTCVNLLPPKITSFMSNRRGTRWGSCLRHYATSR